MAYYIETDEGESITVELSAEYIGNGRQRHKIEVVKKTKSARRQPLREKVKVLDRIVPTSDT